MNLPHVREAGMRPTKACLVGTRVATLDLISAWINAVDKPRVLFIHGGAGTGKSAIAHAIGQRFHDLGRLGSFFCFDRNFQHDRHPESVFSTISRDLADWDAGFRRELAKVLEEQRSLAHTADMITQWNRLIIEPMGRLHFVGPVVVVIDALDESGPTRSQPRLLLLSFLTQRVANLPSNVRIIVTTRLEQDVLAAIHDSPHVDHLDLESFREEASRDIDQYVRSRCSEADYRTETLTDYDYLLLVQKSEGLFQWAFTACEVMLGPGSAGLTLKESFEDFIESLGHDGLHPLDDLYSGILSRLFTNKKIVLDRFRSVMAQIMSACEPLSINALHDIRHHAQGDTYILDEVSLIVQNMGALISGITHRDTPINPLHTSFRDFIMDKRRSGKWHVELAVGQSIMVLGCTRIMNASLRFNMCSLETSSLRNCDITSLPSRISDVISEALSHSCRFWQTYMQPLPEAWNLRADIRLEISYFLKNKLLYWLEVLSLLGCVNQSALSLESAAPLFTVSPSMWTRSCVLIFFTGSCVFRHACTHRRRCVVRSPIWPYHRTVGTPHLYIRLAIFPKAIQDAICLLPLFYTSTEDKWPRRLLASLENRL
jgi:hypothetical protein